MNRSEEMALLEKRYGIQYIKLVLGNFRSYRELRKQHTFSQINESCKDLDQQEYI